MAHTLYVVNDLMAGLGCAGKTFADFAGEVSFDDAMCIALRDNPNSQPLRYRSKVQIEQFVGVPCKKVLNIQEIKGGRFSLF